MRLTPFAMAFCVVSSIAMGGDLLVFSKEGCPPCENFKRDIGGDPDALEGHRVVFAEADSELWAKLGVKSTPTFMLFDENGNLLKSKAGYRGKREFSRWLRD